jgi:hypothetical protein
MGEGFIPVDRFREILKEVDDDFTEDELDDIIFEVSHLLRKIHSMFHRLMQMDQERSTLMSLSRS